MENLKSVNNRLADREVFFRLALVCYKGAIALQSTFHTAPSPIKHVPQKGNNHQVRTFLYHSRKNKIYKAPPPRHESNKFQCLARPFLAQVNYEKEGKFSSVSTVTKLRDGRSQPRNNSRNIRWGRDFLRPPQRSD